ncbi:MAG: ABC transporter permease [Thermomicrobiales bacterium]|nr:ABC transporter permease [Thermomicrobiales bacterium]MCO5218600.1 ABC transporter permease [Thermomicrobiales bacterium]MCO5225648.1 ABC transporter permease [Thermomicrobiales bacterium]MCO5229258.1 ABC transporter permease [Thermomicrobiales bacterium]
MEITHDHLNKPGWKRELIAIWGYAQRNYFLTKRYFLWELVWLVYTIMNALTIGFIGVGFGGDDAARATTFLLIGSMLWSYLSMIFDLLSETVSWERWEGTIEYTFMAPSSRATQLIGMGLYAVLYGLVRLAIMLGVISLFFELSLGEANYLAAVGILAICSLSLVGFGMVAAVMPLLSPEKGQQVTSIFTAVLLLVSGIYYSVDVLPGWLQPMSTVSPVYYALNGIRAALLEGASFGSQWHNIWPLLIMGALFPPIGLWLFGKGEIYAKRTGLLKRAG